MTRTRPNQSGLRIGFVSTRFAGTDGVSLETAKWALTLERLGHACFYFCGECDRPAGRSHVTPEAHFKHPDIEAVQAQAFSQTARPPELTRRIRQLTEHLKAQLYTFVAAFDINLLIAENALAIPMNIPLGLALTELIAETAIPTIAHNHDLAWERKRFLFNCVGDYLDAAFPPALPSVRHAVINSLAGQQLSLRRGVSSVLIPNVMDFESPPPPPDEYTSDLRNELGLAPDELFILQPTRIIPRKGIERAIELTARLERKARLVITHAAGDEGLAYAAFLRDYADRLGVPTAFVADRISEERGRLPDGRKTYTLWDVYPHADLVTYPSEIEGFGNAFLEAIYFRRLIVVNAYPVYMADLKPKGFRIIEFDGYITEETLWQMRQLLDAPEVARDIAAHNYAVARRHYSYTVLESRLQALIAAGWDC
ncbi:MAG: glycosyltransferase family 4 protein [Chloroflexi bacterium]|nr:glycosyltransferase family 4 protein [Chloroflexota bacterium]